MKSNTWEGTTKTWVAGHRHPDQWLHKRQQKMTSIICFTINRINNYQVRWTVYSEYTGSNKKDIRKTWSHSKKGVALDESSNQSWSSSSTVPSVPIASGSTGGSEKITAGRRIANLFIESGKDDVSGLRMLITAKPELRQDSGNWSVTLFKEVQGSSRRSNWTCKWRFQII